MNHYTSLSWSAVSDHAPLCAPQMTEEKLSWNEGALNVLDDFTQHAPLQIKTSTELGEARDLMQSRESRYACVLDNQGELVGILAARDLRGRRAGQFAHELRIAFNEVPVRHLMKSVASLPLVSREQLLYAQIGDAVATLQKSGKDFLLVQERGHIQGLISSLGITDKTGESVHVYHHASSFAEILHAVKHAEEID
ncbi:hypothetical protein CWE09_04405 [Aliidiomarina minuta]|uniref:CBS domain-containing protein n=1 Tax=Aliidiomarina minuta TaxID=880057 RepID=A0A432W7D4_9GAMM|nr:CBS domain-containing protein [Aliidiomarina minuta]RUO25975.1 hypothetical protein CWE09_04405 [Aliidiomarina minuta]